jgi:hypothetical protein
VRIWESAAPLKIDFALPEFAVLAFETTDLLSRKKKNLDKTLVS